MDALADIVVGMVGICVVLHSTSIKQQASLDPLSELGVLVDLWQLVLCVLLLLLFPGLGALLLSLLGLGRAAHHRAYRFFLASTLNLKLI